MSLIEATLNQLPTVNVIKSTALAILLNLGASLVVVVT